VIVEFSLSLMESLVAASIANREERYMVWLRGGLCSHAATNMEMDGSLKGEFRFFILPHDGQEAA
jgi:hypothetical protein